MKHGPDHEDAFALLVQGTLQALMEEAKSRDMCPGCTLAYMSAFATANILLKQGAYANGKFNENMPDLLDACAKGAMKMAVQLDAEGFDWRPGSDEPKLH